MSENHGHAPAASSTTAHPVTVTDKKHGPDAASSHDHHDMHFKLYLGIGALLLIFTGITVWLSYFDFGSSTRNMVIGMAVATFKVTLVAAVFMHLKGEKATIWRFLYFTAFFVAGLFLLTALAWYDPIFGTDTNKY